MEFFRLKSIRLSNTFTNFATLKYHLFVTLQIIKKDIMALLSTIPNVTHISGGVRKGEPLLYPYGA